MSKISKIPVQIDRRKVFQVVCLRSFTDLCIVSNLFDYQAPTPSISFPYWYRLVLAYIFCSYSLRLTVYIVEQ